MLERVIVLNRQLEIRFEGFDDTEEVAKESKVQVVKIEPEPASEHAIPKNDIEKKSIEEVRIPSHDDLYSKAYYSIGEVAKMLHEEVSLVRYWSNEFKIIKPRKNRKGDRFYRPDDVKNIFLIYDLLRIRKFTIEGAKKFLDNEKLALEKFQIIASLDRLKQFLEQLKNNL